jgi:hypothetical protein
MSASLGTVTSKQKKVVDLTPEDSGMGTFSASSSLTKAYGQPVGAAQRLGLVHPSRAVSVAHFAQVCDAFAENALRITISIASRIFHTKAVLAIRAC